MPLPFHIPKDYIILGENKKNAHTNMGPRGANPSIRTGARVVAAKSNSVHLFGPRGRGAAVIGVRGNPQNGSPTGSDDWSPRWAPTGEASNENPLSRGEQRCSGAPDRTRSRLPSCFCFSLSSPKLDWASKSQSFANSLLPAN